MNKRMRLECTVTASDTPEFYTVSSKMYDGTVFSLKVSMHQVVLNEDLDEGRAVPGWVNVEHVGEQAGRAAIVLPAPTLNFGCNVSVNALMLQPMNLNINHFNGTKTTRKVKDETKPSDDNGGGQ
jgi:hypothetical protein